MNKLKIGDIVTAPENFGGRSYGEGIIITFSATRIYTTIKAYVTVEAFGKNLTYWSARILKKCDQS